jgi:hypothetical protein
LILIGPGWQAIFEAFWQAMGEYVPPNQRRWLSFAQDVDAAVNALSL